MAKIKRNPAAEKIAKAIPEAYDVGSVEDMQSARNDVFGPLFEALLKGEQQSSRLRKEFPGTETDSQPQKRYDSKNTEDKHGRSPNRSSKRP